MKNFAKLCVAVLVLGAVSAQARSLNGNAYSHTVTNNTKDHLSVTYDLTDGTSHQHMLAANDTYSWSSGNVCTNYMDVEGPIGTTRMNTGEDKCVSTNYAIDYKKSIFGKNIGYDVKAK